MSQLEQLKSELWALFDRMDKDATGTGIKSGLVAAQAIVAKHTDGFALVPVGLELNAFIGQTKRQLEQSRACANNTDNSQKKDYYTGQSHGIEMVLDAIKDVIADSTINNGWQAAQQATEGYVLVPVEPSQDQIQAGLEIVRESWDDNPPEGCTNFSWGDMVTTYKYMIEAAQENNNNG